MPEPTKIPRPFADSGDKNSIPDSSGGIGFASWQEGFPAITGTPFAQGGVAPKRADFNGVFNALSAATVWNQQGGVYAYDNTTDYEVGNLAEKSGLIYICKIANGPGSAIKDPAADAAETYWARIYPQNGTFNKMFFSYTSGSYTAPYTGVYRITLKGGGGGGAGANANTNGGSGGEGGTIVFFTSLTKSQAYAYIIGAGGTAGGSDTNGAGGGASSITIGGTTYSVNGGDPGSRASITGQGGKGGNSFSGDSNTFFIPGAPGHSGSLASARPRGPSGGGSGGGIDGNANTAGIYGGGGHGASVGWGAATSGGDGFILIEYAG